MTTLSSKLRPLIQRAVKSHGTRSMAILSKESSEEYKKLVRKVKPAANSSQIGNSSSHTLVAFTNMQNYTERMNKTGRPVSPHVTIYAFPVMALSSITNRVTGVMLALGAGGLGSIEIIAGPGSALSLMETIGSQGFLIAAPAKFAVAFPLVYHYAGALRHFGWDYFPEYLNNVDAEKSSYALFGGATVVSGVIMFL
jgi:succinate dehydrogenase (ubiquinone) cytochrome b560 subunit